MIPPQAVEAALSALLPDSDIDSLKGGFWWGNVETILEAAAPHMQGESREMALIARERKRKLDAVVSIAARLGESMQGDDRELSEELYAAMGLD